MATELKSDQIYQRMVELRRNFHRYPELAFKEEQTAKTIMAELDRLGIPYDYGGVGGGIVGRLMCRDENVSTVALRAEMDALPCEENTGLSFASEIKGLMHACGHDAHMSMVLGAAALLAESPPDGNVVFAFQPAEERGGGSRVILDSGALKGVNAIFAGHVTHHYRVGEIMVAEGVITAQSDRFTITVTGKGGHGARPHEAIDAIVIASLLISAIQTLVSRGVDPLHPTVITIGKIQGGSAPNIIAENVVMEGTIRTTLPEARQHIWDGLRRITKAMGELYNANIDIDLNKGYPPVVNSSREAQIAYRAAREIVGDRGLVAMEYPSMGAEDFAYFLHELPGCYVRFGTRIEEDEYIPLHSPQFDINEETLKVGAAFFDQVVREAIQEYRQEF
jgi:hippurate hydrolase